jgi:hypothetical protein
MWCLPQQCLRQRCLLSRQAAPLLLPKGLRLILLRLPVVAGRSQILMRKQYRPE